MFQEHPCSSQNLIGGIGKYVLLKIIFLGVIIVAWMAADATHMLVKNANHHCKGKLHKKYYQYKIISTKLDWNRQFCSTTSPCPINLGYWDNVSSLRVLFCEIFSQKSGAAYLNYSEVVHNSFLFSSYSALNKYASAAKVITEVLIFANEFGILCVFAMFYSQNIQQVKIFS